MDNATAEYTFVTTFFARSPEHTATSKETELPAQTSAKFLSPTLDDEERSVISEPGNFTPVPQTRTIESQLPAISKEDQNALNAIWKQVMDPALEYCQVTTNTYQIESW
jgi:hypothetical protein